MWAGVILRSRALRRVLRDVIAALLLALATEIGSRRLPKR